MENLKKCERQLAHMEREFTQLQIEFQCLVKEDGYHETLHRYCSEKSNIQQLKEKISFLKMNLQPGINSRSNILKDKDPLECKKEIVRGEVIMDGYKQCTKLEAKIRSRQESIVRMEEMLDRMENRSEYELRRSFRERHNLKLRIAEEQIYLQADIHANAKGVDNAPSEYKEHISSQAALIKDLEQKLAKLETETKSNNKILEELAKLQLDCQSNKSWIEQHEKNTINQLAESKSIKEETSANKASIERLQLKLQSYLDKQEEIEEVLDSFKTLLKGKDDQIVLLELGSILDSSKIKEKDDLLRELQDRIANLN